jgi:hypothetical protein
MWLALKGLLLKKFLQVTRAYEGSFNFLINLINLIFLINLINLIFGASFNFSTYF